MLKNFNSLLDFQKAFSTQKKCIKYLLALRWNNKPVCQKCFRNDKTYIYAKDGLYGCGHCKREFGIRKNTIFEDSALDLTKWFLAFYLEISNPKGISSLELSKHLKTRQATCWFVLQRIRWALKHNTIEKMQGDIEVDETYCGGKEINKHQDKKTEGSQAGHNKMAVLGIIQRTGKIVLEYIKKSNMKNIKPILINNINFENTNLFTDESPLYKGFDRQTVNHSLKEYAREEAYTNTIENAFSGFKRRVYGIHHSISKKHISKYINSFCFYFNNKTLDIAERFDVAMGLMFGKRLNYVNLIDRKGFKEWVDWR